MNGLMKLNHLANIRYAYPRMEAVPDMVNTSRPNCLYLFLMVMRSKRQDRIHTSPYRYKLHATLAVAYETPRLLAIIEMMPATKSYSIFMFQLFYVQIHIKVQYSPFIIRDFLSAKVDINMHALVLFICGLYQMPASVYELIVQSISDGPFVS